MKKYPSLSAYSFVRNNPILLLDPDGRIIVNGHDENKESLDHGKTETAISNLKAYNVGMHSFMQTARTTNDGRIVWKDSDGKVYANYNTDPAFDDLNAIYDSGTDISFNIKIAELNGSSGGNGASSSSFSFVGKEHTKGVTKFDPGFLGIKKAGDESFSYFNTKSNKEEEATISAYGNDSYATLVPQNNLVNITLDDDMGDLGKTLSHESGHFFGAVMNVVSYFIAFRAENYKGGHGAGNPSGLEADNQEKMYEINQKKSRE